MDDNNLEKLRSDIDKIDKRILELLKFRFQIVKKIGEYKERNGVEIEDERREKDILEKCKKRGKYLSDEFVEKFITLIIDESKRIQGKK